MKRLAITEIAGTLFIMQKTAYAALGAIALCLTSYGAAEAGGRAHSAPASAPPVIAPPPSSGITSLPTPSQIVANAPASDWVAIDPADLLVMTLAPDAAGHARKVVLQLVPAPFGGAWVPNIRTLAAAQWWDGLAITRVQDNYVVQWGDPNGEDAAKAKPLPRGMQVTREGEYTLPVAQFPGNPVTASNPGAPYTPMPLPGLWLPDTYSAAAGYYKGWQIATDRQSVWPVHCYGALGVGRNLSPDAGTGAELYVVNGHAPRALDTNIAVVGRVISGIEHLSALPRGTGNLGFYATPQENVTIQSIRLASTLPAAEQPHFAYLSTESQSFDLYVRTKANRRDSFFMRPMGAVDICNAPVPVKSLDPS